MKAERILLVETAFIGDLILVTPLIRGIRQAFPGCELDVLASKKAFGVLSGHTGIDNLFVLDKKRKAASVRELLPELRKRSYSLAFMPHGSLTSALIALRAGIPRRIGFGKGTPSILMTERVPFRSSGLRIEKNLDLLRYAVPGDYSRNTALFPSGGDLAAANKVLASLPSDGALIAVAPGSVWPTKRWPAEYYRKLSFELSAKGFRLVFTGSAAEADLCSSVMPSSRAVNAAGRLTLTGTAALVGRCGLMISNDCGAMHIADAMDTPVFAFFGPTVEDLGYFPYREHDRVFQVPLSCRPCGSHGGRSCPRGHHRCMRDIHPARVIDAVMEHFS